VNEQGIGTKVYGPYFHYLAGGMGESLVHDRVSGFGSHQGGNVLRIFSPDDGVREALFDAATAGFSRDSPVAPEEVVAILPRPNRAVWKQYGLFESSLYRVGSVVVVQLAYLRA
jgi:hypothetical protein